MKNFFLVFMLMIGYQMSQGQSLEFGFLGGMSVYNGDLSPKKYSIYLQDVRPAGGIFLRNVVHPKLAVRGSFMIGILGAKDEGRANEDRGLDFKSTLLELGVIGEIHPFRNARNMRTLGVSPYFFGGIAGYYFNPKTEYQGETITLQPIGTEGQGLPNAPEKYNRVQLSIPFGIGLHFEVNDRISIGAEFGPRLLFTDYLDDVSNQPVNYGILVSNYGTLAGELSIRNPDDRPTEPTNDTYQRGGGLKDWYYIGTINIGFKIHGGGSNQFGCPGF